MFNTDLIFRARWDQLYELFFSGYPPLILKLLAINTLFVTMFIYRRATSKSKSQHRTAYGIQALLIAANFIMVLQNDLMSLSSTARSMLHF